jgi:hypothetical protein
MSEKWWFRKGVDYTVTQIEPPASATNVWGPFETEEVGWSVAHRMMRADRSRLSKQIKLVRRKLARMKAKAERAALRDAAREKAHV